MLLKGANIFTKDCKFTKADILIEDGVIKEIGNICGEGEDFSGKYIIPGLIDIHTHGAVKTETMDFDFAFEKWQNYLFGYGVTTFFPSTVSGTDEQIIDCLKKMAENDKVEGVNLEGPYINAAKKGAHVEETLRGGNFDEFAKYMEISKNKIKLTTVAPETPGNLEFIKEITEKSDVKVALGHSTATYEEAMEGIKAGATQLTHTFNAMPPLGHREPGLAGAAFDNDAVFCEVISDGIHLHPAIVRLLYKALGSDRMVLISDSMAATGLDDGSYRLGGAMEVTVTDGVARTPYGAIAGSTKNLMQMVRSAINFGIPKEEAIKMATITPARAVNIDNFQGSIEAGKKADLVICDENLEVIKTIKNGEVVFG